MIREIKPDPYYPVGDNIIHSLNLYVNHKIAPGGFLTAVLENNLSSAFGRADNTNSANMRNIVAFIYNNIPSDCWGSEEKVRAWLGE